MTSEALSSVLNKAPSQIKTTETLPGEFTVGSRLTLKGSTHSYAGGFLIDLQCGPKNRIFRLLVDFTHVNERVDSNQGEVQPPAREQPFIIHITYNLVSFTVRLNERIVCCFRLKRTVERNITHLTIDGSVTVNEIRLTDVSSVSAEDEDRSRSTFSEERLPLCCGSELRGTISMFEEIEIPRALQLLRMIKFHLGALRVIQIPKMCPIPIKFFSIGRIFSALKMPKRTGSSSLLILRPTVSSMNPFSLQIIK